MNKKKEIILGIIILLIGISLSVFLIISSSKPTTIYATVTYLENNYLIVTTKTNQEYKIKTQKNYEIGDQLSFEIKNKKRTTPIEGEVKNIKKLNNNISFTIEDERTPATTKTETNATNSKESFFQNNLDTPEELIPYLEELNQEIDKNPKLTTKIKQGFTQIVDFLFYNGTIKGKTFEQLSDETKLKVLKLCYTIDSKIEKKYPDYKEGIKDTTTSIKEKILSSYLDITTTLCTSNEEACQSAKEGLKEMKESFSLTWNSIKNMSGKYLSKLKSWYEVWRDIDD